MTKRVRTGRGIVLALLWGACGKEAAAIDCEPPPCLRIDPTCVGTGACVQAFASDATDSRGTMCFANGVKVRSASSLDRVAMAMSIQQIHTLGNQVCYSTRMTVPVGTDLDPATPTEYFDGAGQLVATTILKSDPLEMTVTCAGVAPVRLPGSCLLAKAAASVDGGADAEACPEGTCVP